MLQVVLVRGDTTYRRARRDYTAPLMFGRPVIAPPAAPSLSLLRAKRPPPALFRRGFTVYPVIEAFSQSGTSTPAIFSFEVASPSGRAKWGKRKRRPKRANHALLNQFRGQYVAQLVPYTFELPDLNSPKWKKRRHRKQDDEVALFPFRQIPQFIRGQPYNLYFDQPKPWKIGAKRDTAHRRPATDALAFQAYARANVFVNVPNVVGLTQSAATSALSASGLSLGTVTTSFSITVPNGIVSAQSPAPGALIPVTSAVAITVSLGRAPGGFVEVPNVVGVILQQALQMLEKTGVLVPASLGYFGTYPVAVQWVASNIERGFVIAQSVTPGFFVKPNSPITLTVSEFAMAVVFPGGGGNIA